MDVTNHLSKFIIAIRILFLLGIAVATPAGAATFDGARNVASSNSACASGATVSIGSNNGQVASNNPMMAASGRVADAGNISVTLASVGLGHLAATSGSGTWRGAAQCQ